MVLGFCNQTPQSPTSQNPVWVEQISIKCQRKEKRIARSHPRKLSQCWLVAHVLKSQEMIMAGALLMSLSMCCDWGWLWWPSPQASVCGLWLGSSSFPRASKHLFFLPVWSHLSLLSKVLSSQNPQQFGVILSIHPCKCSAGTSFDLYPTPIGYLLK